MADVDPADIPDALADRDQWICWRTECRECGHRVDPTVKSCPECGEKPTKRPINPHTGGLADVSDPDTWGGLQTAIDHNRGNDATDGLGFVFDSDGLLAGVDLDGCRDPDTGEVEQWAKECVRTLDSYTEVSPSGTGLHIIAFGFIPDGGNRRDGVEMYDGNRYFTVTGEHVDGTPESVAKRADALQQVHADYVADDDRNGSTDTSNTDGDTERAEPDGELEFTNDNGTPLAKIRELDDKLDDLLTDIEPANYDYPSPSEADAAACSKLYYWRFTEQDIARIMRTYRSRPKINDRDDYLSRTIDTVKGGGQCDPIKTDGGTQARSGGGQTVSGSDSDDSDVIADLFATACEHYNIDPFAIKQINRDGDTYNVSVYDLFEDIDSGAIDSAVMRFNRDADALDGTDKQAVVGRVVYLDLRDHGEFFRTSDDRLFYFYDPEKEVYRVDGVNNRILDEDFQALVHDRYNLFAGTFSRNLGTDLKSNARRDAPEKRVYQFAHYNADAGELYVTDWGDGYYAISDDGVERRPNGTDVFFLSDDVAEPYDYLDPDHRPELPDQLGGERPMWQGAGDAIMRVFGNRVNYDESAALGPLKQRQQLYLHLHTLPFIDVLNARPIMAWVGEKGSGKTVIERSIGQFLYGPQYRESVMPDGRDDFLTKVTNQALAFVDNYDDGEEWANDLLAAIATGSGIDKRELFTTNTLRRETPRCWLSITSRDPPFRRDDVADRTLVFRVERLDDADENFIGMGAFLNVVHRYRDLLWSVYLDNLQAVISEYLDRDTATMSSSHRMADWAIFARIVADALDVPDVDELLETMETERATFALENEPWARVIDEWISDEPGDAATWRSASSLLDRLDEYAGDNDLHLGVTSPQGLGAKLNQYDTELSELYHLEIQAGHSNEYRFNVDDDTEPTGLAQY